MSRSFVSFAAVFLGGTALLACNEQPDKKSSRASRADKYATADVPVNDKGPPAVEASKTPAKDGGETHAAEEAEAGQQLGGPPQTEDADILERAAMNPMRDFTPVGTKGHLIRCQAAMPDADLVFAPSWYTYDDRANPDTPIHGCERGHSESMVEVKPWGEGRTLLCSVGWTGLIREGTPYPYVGMGVRTNGGLEGTRRFTIETRSTGESLELSVHLIMEAQQHMLCGDEEKAPYEHTVVCDGTGEWKAQTLELSKFAPRWGKPKALDLMTVSSVHFQNLSGFEGGIACDFRIVDAE